MKKSRSRKNSEEGSDEQRSWPGTTERAARTIHLRKKDRRQLFRNASAGGAGAGRGDWRPEADRETASESRKRRLRRARHSRVLSPASPPLSTRPRHEDLTTWSGRPGGSRPAPSR